MQLRRGFSQLLRSKVPKDIPPLEDGFLSKLLHRSKSSPTYGLLWELFQYLQSTPLIKEEFPLIKSSARLETNLMIVHTLLLRERLNVEKGLPSRQKETLNYNLKSYFFIPYAKFVEKNTPVTDFGQHFIDSYQKRYDLYGKALAELEELRQGTQLSGMLEGYQECFRRIVYENKAAAGDSELIKLSKYYLGHKRYLGMLGWQDLVKYKVAWGFTRQPGQLEFFTRE